MQRLQRERSRGLQIAKPVLMMNGEGFGGLAHDRRRTVIEIENPPPSVGSIGESAFAS